MSSGTNSDVQSERKERCRQTMEEMELKFEAGLFYRILERRRCDERNIDVKVKTTPVCITQSLILHCTHHLLQILILCR